MTVAELIVALSAYPQDAKVVCSAGTDGYDDVYEEFTDVVWHDTDKTIVRVE